MSPCIPPMFRRPFVGLLLVWMLALIVPAAETPAIEQVLSGIRSRLRRVLPEPQLLALDEKGVLEALTPWEREFLGRSFIRFEVDVPSFVYVLRSIREQGDVFWLRDLGFELTDLAAEAGGRRHKVWRKSFPAGIVGLGVNSFRRSNDPCFFVVCAEEAGRRVRVTPRTPDYLRINEARPGALAYADDLMEIDNLPGDLRGGIVVRPNRWVRDHARIVNYYRRTEFPSANTPDQVLLTWSGDPRTSQDIEWRTGPGSGRGAVAYMTRSAYRQFTPRQPRIVAAKTRKISNPEILNDPVIHRHEARLEGLEPGTPYVYWVGDGSPEGWLEAAEFTTAPDTARPFSFLYLGDAQHGFERWHTLMNKALRRRPDAAFCLMAGDMVNAGMDREDWDRLLHFGAPVFRRQQLVPVVGNHEAFGPDRRPAFYLDLFRLPENGPRELEPERVYSMEYAGVLILVLDSMLPAGLQARWMEKVLSQTRARWKIVASHFSIYSAGYDGSLKSLREHWVPVFDRYGIDFVLQGHDHVYARSLPLRQNRPVASGETGTYYITSFSGTNAGEGRPPHTQIGFERVATYQVFDVQTGGDRLVYRAYDIDGHLKDEVIVEK